MTRLSLTTIEFGQGRAATPFAMSDGRGNFPVNLQDAKQEQGISLQHLQQLGTALSFAVYSSTTPSYKHRYSPLVPMLAR